MAKLLALNCPQLDQLSSTIFEYRALVGSKRQKFREGERGNVPFCLPLPAWYRVVRKDAPDMDGQYSALLLDADSE